MERGKEGHYEDAIRCSRKAIERKANCEDAYWILGRALIQAERWPEAADIATDAIESSADDYNVHIQYKAAFERLGQKEAALQLRENIHRY